MADIAKVIPYVLGLYLLLKVVDLVVAGDVGAAFSGGLNTILFWVEMIIGVILPIIFFSMESVRNDRYKRFWTAVLVVVGIVFNRLMISVIAFDAGPYVPSWQELFITIGWVSVGVMAFYLAGRFLPLFPEEH